MNAISRHLKVLERAGLIEREVIGREHYCRLSPDRLEAASDWLAYYRAFWSRRLDALERELFARRQARRPNRRQSYGPVTIEGLAGLAEEVIDMWLDPNSLRRWMCPGDTWVSRAEVDPVVGGAFRIDMQTPDGGVLIHTGRYLEVRRPDRLVFTWISSATGQAETRVTLDLYPHPRGCRLELCHDQLPNQQAVDLHVGGWTDILGRLDQSRRVA